MKKVMAVFLFLVALSFVSQGLLSAAYADAAAGASGKMMKKCNFVPGNKHVKK